MPRAAMLRRAGVLLVLAALVALAGAAQALASGLTNSSDNFRDGWYPDQTSLTPQLVSGGTFGQLWSATVEGQVYAQPLLYNGTLLVATQKNKVYGLDPANGAMRWPAPLDLGTPWNPADISCADLTPSIGVTATPVIDPATNTGYLTHKNYVSGTSGPARWYMDAVDLATGKEKPGFPVELSGSAQNVPTMTFQPTRQLQRPGLLLMNGVVYAAFGSHCDFGPWQGWVFGVSTGGEIKARWVAMPSGNGAGIWQSGSGLASDGPGSLMVATGNGGGMTVATPGKTPPASGPGEAVIRLAVQPDGSLKSVDFFSPFDATSLDSADADFASGGVTMLNEEFFGTLTAPHLQVEVGKDGYVYLLNRDDLGGFQQGPGGADKVVQRIGPYGGVWSRPGVWPGDGGWVYIPTASGGSSAGGSSGFLRVYQYGVSGTGQPTLSLQATSSDAFGFTSSAPEITSDGTNPGSALVWMVWTPNSSGVGAQLRAYDPIPVEGKPVLRWSAPIGTSAKFAMPGVGAGRVYVGTRDGKVLGFGSPVTPLLTGPATHFPTTTLGNTSEQTLTLTATNAVTLTGLTSSSPQFTIGAPSPALPASLAAGQTITIPLKFTPTTAGLLGATLTAETDKGTVSFAMSGSGQTASPQLTSSPLVVSFGGTTAGGHLSGAATFRNVGGAPLTISAIKLPAAPFSATGLPAVGSTIAAGGAVTVSLNFDPTEVGNFTGELVMESTGGNRTVNLTGSAGAPGVLNITSESNEFANLEVGQTATKSFTVANTGGTNITITKSKPPTGGAMAATSSLAEGTTVAPGETLKETVTFTPTAPGYAGGVWLINGDDTSGLHEVTFSGTGTVPPPGSAWSLNGSATLSAGVLQTTPATSNLAGSAFFTKALDSRHLAVEFDQTINSGSGADGQTVTFADATRASTAALGEIGGGLGFAGIPGLAVAFDTYQGNGAPSNNFVGITDGPGISPAPLHWLTTATSIPNLRSAIRHVKVEALNGTITVWIDGTQVLTGTATIPPKVLVGFTGATGGLNDVHKAANVTITGDPPPGKPVPASLKIATTVSAAGGSPQAGATFAYSGSCPSSFTAGPLGTGGSATPTLTGAVSGASCSVSEAAPSEAGWKTTASVNGGAEVTLTASGGQLAVPAFALAGGVNTVQFTNTYTPPGAVPDPTAGGWQLNGSAALTASELVLTPASSGQKGSAFWPKAIDPRTLTVEFDATIGGGTGADGLTLAFGDTAKGAQPTSLGVAGGGLGFSGIPGIAVALDTYKNAANPSNNFLGVSDGPIATAADQLKWIATANLAAPLVNATHHIKVITSGGTLTAYVDGTQVLSHAVTMPSSAYLGFTGGTGGAYDRHAVAHLVINNEAPPPPPASLRIATVVNAPSGSPQAATTFAYSGSCPSSFTAGPLGNGGSATPALTGAVAGASCSVSEAASSETGWKTTVSVNGGTEVTLTPSGGQLTVPAFALAAGANTVQFTNTYTPASGSLIPDPTAGGWQLNGNAALTASELVLTTATSFRRGTGFWPKAIDPRTLTVEFDATIGGGTGADGLALVFGDTAKGAKPTSIGVDGGGLGFSGIPGIAVALDTYKNAVNPSNNFLGVSDGPTTTSTHQLKWIATANLAVPLENATRHIKVTASGGTLTAFVDGTQVLSHAVTLPASAYVGFSGGTGGANDRHAISHLTVTSP